MRRSYAAAVASEAPLSAGEHERGGSGAPRAAEPAAAADAHEGGSQQLQPQQHHQHHQQQEHGRTQQASVQGQGQGQGEGPRLQVLGAGFGRTGTLSLYVALNALGYRTHHMAEVINNPGQAPAWYQAGRERGAAADGGAAPACSGGGGNDDKQATAAYWCAPGLLGGYSAAVDWPAAAFLPQLLTAHPDLLVVLTSRDFDAWYDSARRTIFEMSEVGRPLVELPLHMRLLLAAVAPPLGRLRRMMLMVEELVWGPRGTFRGRFADKDFVFDEHYAQVRRLVPRGRLLEYDVRQGWGPLCAFLGRAPPSVQQPAAGGGGGAAAAAAAIKPPIVKLPGWRGHAVKGGSSKEAVGGTLTPTAATASSAGTSGAKAASGGIGSSSSSGQQQQQQQTRGAPPPASAEAAALAAEVAAAPLPFPHVNDTAEFRERMEAVRRLVRSIKWVQRGVEAAAAVGLGALLARLAAAALLTTGGRQRR
ncbi:hypothetical protein HYH02_013718 [Chlamydomonas schloesseri]|uniref:Sulfotransferase n=1 Tax=Chlamydomonas schloesseri TaxID=2026947 RepID=A0A835T2G9_9CHLO|nr:hypothetical protein HYH02_013718 [Chlamydomonas schloesseri]|eukprot:KAG2430356.1 hypothetical protein HYH02_013718 [Chlamydomonas schloesseri]